jgi:hypothetical protein
LSSYWVKENPMRANWHRLRPGPARWALLLVAIGLAVSACNGSGGDPVQGGQIPRAEASQDGGESSGEGSGEGSGGESEGNSGEGGSGRKTGLPKTIRLPEIDSTTFRSAVEAACGSLDGNPECLSVTIEPTVNDELVPGPCSIEWDAQPPEIDDESDPSGASAIVQRGSVITATETCPGPGPTDVVGPTDEPGPTDETGPTDEVEPTDSSELE